MCPGASKPVSGPTYSDVPETLGDGDREQQPTAPRARGVARARSVAGTLAGRYRRRPESSRRSLLAKRSSMPERALGAVVGAERHLVEVDAEPADALTGPRAILRRAHHRRRFLGEVVERQRLPRHARRAGHRVRMAVERRRIRAEDHAAVEERPDLPPARAHLGVPQLEVAAVGLLPARVQVEEQVQPAPPVAAVRVHGEVGVHVEEAAALRLVQPAALERLVGEEVRRSP